LSSSSSGFDSDVSSVSVNQRAPRRGIAVDRLGQVYFLDTGSGLWRIDTRGGLSHLSRTLFHWLAIDQNNRFANTQIASGARGEILKIGSNLPCSFPATIPSR
jgi:hypothetical protein